MRAQNYEPKCTCRLFRGFSSRNHFRNKFFVNHPWRKSGHIRRYCGYNHRTIVKADLFLSKLIWQLLQKNTWRNMTRHHIVVWQRQKPECRSKTDPARQDGTGPYFVRLSIDNAEHCYSGERVTKASGKFCSCVIGVGLESQEKMCSACDCVAVVLRAP